MRLAERLLRLIVPPHEASALIGDLEEHAAQHATDRWRVRWEVLRWIAAALTMTVRRKARRMLTTLRLSFRDALRTLRRSPASTALALGILTVAMAAGTVTFAVVDAIVLRPLPYPASGELVSIFGATSRDPRAPHVSLPDFEAWREGTTSFASLAAWQTPWPFQLPRGESRDEVSMVAATASLFEVLQARPILGTLFTAEHEQPGLDGVAVISEALWERHFDRGSDVLGRTLQSPGGEVTIVGVMPRGFAFPIDASTPVGVWRPLAPKAELRDLTTGRVSFLRVIGRLERGSAIEQARIEVETISRALAADHPQVYVNWRPRVERTLDAMTEQVAGWMRLVLAAVGLLVVIGCANVANLMLTKLERRTREISVRASLGASRMQLATALLAESVVLAALAVGGGLLAAHLLLDLVVAALPAGMPRAETIALDARVLTASALAVLFTIVTVGLMPAWQAARMPIATSIKGGGAGTAGSPRGRWQNLLLVTQVGLVTTLLVATTLLVGSFVQVLRTDLGFSSQNLLGIRITTPMQPKLPPETLRALYADAQETARVVPGVTSVALSMAGPLQIASSSTTRLSVPGRAAGEAVSTSMHRVSPSYFETAGVSLLHGRALLDVDRAQPVVVLDEGAARRLFGDRNPVGERVALPNLAEQTVVGVVKTVRQLGPEGAVLPQMYSLLSDAPGGTVTMVVRTSVPAATVAPDLLARIQPLLPPGSNRLRVEIYEDQLRLLTAHRRFSAWLMTALGILALVIGIGGIYATTAAVVAQRTREIGIRMALGASIGRVIRHVTARTARLLGLGAALGMLAAWSLSGLVTSVVFGLQPTDAVVYVIPAALIALGGVLAALLPALRAGRIDPLITLRTE